MTATTNTTPTIGDSFLLVIPYTLPHDDTDLATLKGLARQDHAATARTLGVQIVGHVTVTIRHGNPAHLIVTAPVRITADLPTHRDARTPYLKRGATPTRSLL